MKTVTKEEAKLAGKSSTLNALFTSLRKWLCYVEEGGMKRWELNRQWETCALCARFNPSQCECTSKNGTCPLSIKTDKGCCLSYQKAHKIATSNGDPKEFQQAAKHLCNDIMYAITNELNVIAGEAEIIHKVGNKYKHPDFSNLHILASITHNQCCLINMKTGCRTTYAQHVKNFSRLMPSEWKKLSDNGRMMLVR